MADVNEDKENTKVYTFTNTYVPEKRTITAYKVWDDQDDHYSTRPAEVKYELWCRYERYERQSVINDEGKEIVSFVPASGEAFFNGLVYDPDKSAEEQSAVYQAMLSDDPTLTGDKAKNYFAKILNAQTTNEKNQDAQWRYNGR